MHHEVGVLHEMHGANIAAAVTPDEAAQSLVSFIDKFDISKTGEYWAPRGPGYVFPLTPPASFQNALINGYRDIGTAEDVLGRDLPTPLQLPW